MYQLLPSKVKGGVIVTLEVHLSSIVNEFQYYKQGNIQKLNTEKGRQTCSLRETAMSLMILQNDKINMTYVQMSFKHSLHPFKAV